MDSIDIGVNLAHDSFDADRDAVMQRAAAAGVRQMIVTGASVGRQPQGHRARRAHPGRLFATAGVHPHHAADLTEAALAELKDLARENEVVAAGECGLDYFRDFSPRDLQRRAFGWQLEVAAATGKPVFLHQRDAHDDFLAILREHMAVSPAAWRIASRRARRSVTPTSSSDCTSASRAGSATNAAACTCAKSSGAFPPTASCSRPTPPIYCRVT